MECNRCGDPMMMETVIKLRRRLFGFRETRSQGAYCATCKIGVPVENHQSVSRRPTAVSAPSRRNARELLPMWRYTDAQQPDRGCQISWSNTVIASLELAGKTGSCWGSRPFKTWSAICREP
jgi:hypothetical protein